MSNRSFARTLVSVVLSIGGLAGAGVAATATTADAAATVTRSAAQPRMATDTYEQRVLYWINVKRDRHGLRPLRLQTCTDNFAERWSKYLAENYEFYHQSMSRMLSVCDASFAGETLAKGAVSPLTMVKMWMHSSGHRAILLSPKPRRIGVGAVADSTGTWVVAADFTRF